jgi:hypothetical protein
VSLTVGFALALAVGFVLVHPLTASPVGYDTAGSVLYFERLLHGQILEQPYGATPKPAMTLIDGLLYSIRGWTAISLAAVAVYAAVATLGAELARRLAGSTAGVFAFVALLGSRPLILDASRAYAVGCASLWLILAGFALRAERPRYVVIGLALAMAALTRLECIVAVIGAVGAVAAWHWLGPRCGLRPAPRSAWFVALGLLAIPIMLVHDWLLIRNPFYWASVSANYSDTYATSVLSPAALANWLVLHYLDLSVLVALACLGILVLVQRRSMAVAIGLLLLGPGIGAFLMLLAAHGTYVSARYVYLIDLAVTFGAAVGFSVVRAARVPGRIGQRRQLMTALAWICAAAVGAGAGGPFGPLDSATRGEVFDQQTVSANVHAVEPVLRRELQADHAAAVTPEILAPGLWTGLLIVDLGLQIPAVGAPRFTADGAAYDSSQLHGGELIYHDRTGDPANAADAALEAGGPVRMGAFTLVPIDSDATAGWWIYRVEGLS